MGASPKPFVQWILPLTKGPIFVADASKFTGIELKAKGKGAYRLVLESYGIDNGDWFAAPFDAGDGSQAIRIPFVAFQSHNAHTQLDLTQLRALRVQLLSAVRFY